MYESLLFVLNTLTTNVLQQLTEIPAALALLLSELILCFIYNNANTPSDVHEISKLLLFPRWKICTSMYEIKPNNDSGILPKMKRRQKKKVCDLRQEAN